MNEFVLYFLGKVFFAVSIVKRSLEQAKPLAVVKKQLSNNLLKLAKVQH